MVSLYKIVNEYGLRLAFCVGKVQVKSPFLEILACADADFFLWEIVVISCVGSTTFPRCEVVAVPLTISVFPRWKTMFSK
ncbi:hypothetical protein [Bifidobacterium pseudocatenulatum]|uniref:hypothetical protein n=1 Tax=Bifidobacterium pseudocatenulatum TaxID=28026 RepID=UPI001D00C677|nr:hypothetical protein [Bifidobacterium pseudocatenulatum]